MEASEEETDSNTTPMRMMQCRMIRTKNQKDASSLLLAASRQAKDVGDSLKGGL